MRMAASTIDDKIKAAREKHAQTLKALFKEKQLERSRLSAQTRKLDTRKKILAGAWFLANCTPDDKAKMVAGLAEKDRVAFE